MPKGGLGSAVTHPDRFSGFGSKLEPTGIPLDSVEVLEAGMVSSNAPRFDATFTLILVGLLAVVMAALALPAAAQTASFQGLGQMPGAMSGAGTFANAISGDGSTIVGYAWVCPDGTTTCTSSGKTEAFRWTVAGKYLVLRDLGSSVGSMALATSANGSVIVGDAPKGQNSFGAFRWTAAHGMVALPVSMLYGNGVTGDGTMVVGQDNWWKTSGKVGKFGPFPGNQDQTQTVSVGGTGAAPIAVGAALKGSDPNGATFHAFRWTPSGGLQDLGLTTGSESIAIAISEDGAVIVGEARDASGFWRAFRWTASTGMEDIGTLGGPESAAYGVNHDGSVIVGTSLNSSLSDSNDAFVWTAKTGMQSLRAVLQAKGVHTADAWVQVTAAPGVSADGTVITGFGLSPRTKAFPFGVWTPFRVVLPVP
jgi:probable HAF family extracellular repeat protein